MKKSQVESLNAGLLISPISPVLKITTDHTIAVRVPRAKILVTFIVSAGLLSLLLSYDFTQGEETKYLYDLLKAGLNAGEKPKQPQQQQVAGTNSYIWNRNNNTGVERIPRVLCWVMTSPKNHAIRDVHVKMTWGRRCNKLIFMSTQNDSELGAVQLPNVGEGRSNLWHKTREAFKYVWENHRDDADWFLKADDDTYVVLENLKYLLSKRDPSEPIFFGCRFKSLDNEHKNGYMSGGAGYVLSKAAVQRFAEIPQGHKCFGNPEGDEDLEMGECLEEVGVSPGDDRDKIGQHRFMPLPAVHYFNPYFLPKGFWYWSYIVYPQKLGKECCSDTAISFHYIDPASMYALDYLIYRIKAFGFPFNSTKSNLCREQMISLSSASASYKNSTTNNVKTEESPDKEQDDVYPLVDDLKKD